ncbi:putative protein phosphatase 2C 19 [Acorus calamus]|uniref:Telomere length regulation protein conserved domain-containing protein n=1 Tax=Acorus calamus TaxID=4465 RepID=A0AAV9CMY9_ACOCL|nr:putative protein phosphatase 2C 19 [Acorus calamus]
MEAEVLRRVGEVAAAVDGAKCVDEVICALHSLAVLLFPVDSNLLAGSIDDHYKHKVLNAVVPSQSDSNCWKHAFYSGPAFSMMARILLYNIASNWLTCIPISAQMQVYDQFFISGPSIEILQALVPALTRHGINEDFDLNAICSNVERLLVSCLLSKKGVHHMVREIEDSCRNAEKTGPRFIPYSGTLVSRVSQLLASIPDKVRMEAPKVLSSHLLFKQITIQLLDGAEECATELYVGRNILDEAIPDSFLLVGESFARICRRGSADVLLAEMIPKVLNHVRGCLAERNDSIGPNMIESNPKSKFWMKIIEAIGDAHAVERLSEKLLRQLATENITDLEAYWILWMLFHRSLEQNVARRALFLDKFLFWKVFPLCCLKWVLQFSVFKCPPHVALGMQSQTKQCLLDTVQRLIGVWSKREFVQSSSTEQQAYITAAVGLCLEKMSKEELEGRKEVMHSLLQGVSCRLESPIHLVRRMASCIALVFSKIVDPEKPLYLDDSLTEETIDWEFGLTSQHKGVNHSIQGEEIVSGSYKTSIPGADSDCIANERRHKEVKSKGLDKDTMLSEFKLVDPDEIVDPASLDYEKIATENDDSESQDSEGSSDSSLQPYDLTDDGLDLKSKVSQLGDVVAALRKPDDPDAAEWALEVAEKLIRALPDELRHCSADLVRALVQVRCSDLAVEGEEESAEAKRQKALVSLLVSSPFESLEPLTNLLYSPNVDISQRILILDVMTDAAQELSETQTIIPKQKQRDLISTISVGNPWFLPSSGDLPGAGPWKEISEHGSPLSWSYRYERELPSKPSQTKTGKSRRWGFASARIRENQSEWSKNKFPMYAAAFMLPVMQGFDKKRHGVDLLDRDFVVLGKLIYMLGVCMKCTAMHPEASALAPALLDMLSSRGISQHPEAFVRRSVLFACSCILASLHPSHVASSLIEGNHDITRGLDWIRTWALQVADSEADTECSAMAMTCLQLHAEMALQASRSLESVECFRSKPGGLPSKGLKREIILPLSNMNI